MGISISPILPPDCITIDGKEVQFDKPANARKIYNSFLHKTKNFRRYIPGSYHKNMFNKKLTYEFDWNQLNNFDIKVVSRNQSESYIKVRKAPIELVQKISILHNRLKKEKPNCRGKKTGDFGMMYALGYNRRAKEGDEYISTQKSEEITNLMREISIKRKLWLQKELLEDYSNNFSTPVGLKKFEFCLSDFMIHSMNLCNPSHYDVNDDSISVCTWIEDEPGTTDNWYLVFPNTTLDYKTAVIIKLFHGCTITWDARVLRHASSKTIRLRGGDSNTSGNCELRKKRTKQTRQR